MTSPDRTPPLGGEGAAAVGDPSVFAELTCGVAAALAAVGCVPDPQLRARVEQLLADALVECSAASAALVVGDSTAVSLRVAAASACLAAAVEQLGGLEADVAELFSAPLAHCAALAALLADPDAVFADLPG